jgi:hypothetical protein
VVNNGAPDWNKECSQNTSHIPHISITIIWLKVALFDEFDPTILHSIAQIDRKILED